MNGFRKGQSLTEYGLLITLVALIAVAALVLLGGSISETLASMMGPAQASAPAEQSSPPGSEKSKPPSTTTVEAQPPAAAPSEKQLGASYDPNSGIIVLSGLDSGSSGRVTTSSQGTEAAALALKRLSEIATKDDGTPADPDTLGILGDLAALGHKLAQQEGSLKMQPSTDTNSKAYLEYYNSGINDTYNEYVALHRKLEGMLGSNPEYSNLMTQVQDYSGIISGIGAFNFISQYIETDTLTGSQMTLDHIRTGMVGTDLTLEPLSVPLEPLNMQTSTVAINPDATLPLDSTHTEASADQLEQVKK